MQPDRALCNRLPCGCTTEGHLCDEHRPRFWGDAVAAGPAALVVLALFIGMIAIWAAILPDIIVG